MAQNQFRWIIRCLIVFITVLLLALVTYRHLQSPYGHRKFESQVWRSASVESLGNEPTNPRGPMTEDLIKHVLALGQSKSQTLELLGRPDMTKTNTHGCEGISYYIGGYSGGYLLPGYDYLCLEFDSDDKLIKKTILKSG
jgi:hypothetical protein